MGLKWISVVGIALLAVPVCAQETPSLKTEQEIISYGIGYDVAKNLKKQGVDVNLDLLVKGLKDGYAGQNPPLAEKELRQVMRKFQADVRRDIVLKRRAEGEQNRKQGAGFLAANKTKEGVVTLPSGLQYKILKEGHGKKPADSDTVQCYYRGTLIDGTEFDATEAGKPADLKISLLIPGWKQALKMMPVGSHWQIFVPSQLAYGDRGAGNEIGPNATLIFDVELLAIK
ncbi:outer membrane protein MIP [Geotalea uraniireducens]|uniref:Peptidyl-prolyl cis-trans isomerase n=1 Tax=Geotalea uraniireducens TaxID=351604 RepID=A0ABN6VXI6_9BACT|nr:FKBP-type peptidyl-prolyl cis-trans isomerase [Geotalea uraniireducens]BDV43760.1 outer membrane protein MIP [Geotalea uraniireducens]